MVKRFPEEIDLSPYAGRWVALVRGKVTGVGTSAQEARRASKHQRPKDEPRVVFVGDKGQMTEDEGQTTKDE